MKKYIRKFLVGWGVNAVAIYIASTYLISFNYDSWKVLAVVSLIFTLIAIFTKPFLKLLSLPFFIFAPIFFFVVYAGILFLISKMVLGFDVGDLQTALLAGAIIAVMNFIANLIV